MGLSSTSSRSQPSTPDEASQSPAPQAPSSSLKNQTHRDAVVHAIKQDKSFGWLAIEHAPAELKDDRDIISLAVSVSYLALQFASPRLQNDAAIVKAAIKQDGYALRYSSAKLRAEREIVKEAVSKNWRALEYASPSLQDDWEIVARAVEQSYYALKHASPSLRRDCEIVRRAFETHARARGDRDFSDREFMEAALRQSGSIALHYSSTGLRASQEFMVEAVRLDVAAREFASEELQQNVKFQQVVAREEAAAAQLRAAMATSHQDDNQGDNDIMVCFPPDGGCILL